MGRTLQTAWRAFYQLGKWLVASLFALILAIPAETQGASSPLGLDMTIFLEEGGRFEKAADPTHRAGWPVACDTLKSLFENPNGRFGHGPFSSVKCLAKPTTLDRLTNKSPKPSWAMQVTDNDKLSGIAIYFMGAEKPRLEAMQQATASEKFLEGLGNKKVASGLALILQDALPMFSLVQLNGDERQLEVDSPLLPDPIPVEFTVYTLRFEKKGGYWAPKPVGYITSENIGLSRDIRWKLTLHEGSFPGGQMLFAHNEQGRGSTRSATSDRLSGLLGRFGINALIDGLMTALSQNLSGIRYGYPLPPNVDVVSKSKMLSLFTEVRAGALTGLRLYYDTAPKVTDVTADGEQVYFGWSSMEAGWAFNLNLPKWLSPIANRIDLQPRAGMISLDTKLVGTDELGLRWASQFKIDRATVYGLEIGLERDFIKKSLLRGWAGALYSWSALGITQTQFLSIRSGVDFYWDLFDMGPLRFKGLLFGSMENLSIQKKFTLPADNKKVDLSGEITGVTYQLMFCGLGVTIAW